MKVFSAKEVANILQVHEETVKRWLREGTLEGFKAGKEWRVTSKDLEDHIEKLKGKEKS